MKDLHATSLEGEYFNFVGLIISDDLSRLVHYLFQLRVMRIHQLSDILVRLFHLRFKITALSLLFFGAGKLVNLEAAILDADVNLLKPVLINDGLFLAGG